MKETYFYTKGNDYELFVQTTTYSHFTEVITVINHDNKWWEDKTQYTDIEYGQLQFPKTYQSITETKFESAQNEVLRPTGKTRTELSKLYNGLWFSYLVERLRIEEWLIESTVDLSDLWSVTMFREQKTKELDLNPIRQAIHTAFNQNHPEIISHQDIFDKMMANKLENYLERRAQIHAKRKK